MAGGRVLLFITCWTGLDRWNVPVGKDRMYISRHRSFHLRNFLDRATVLISQRSAIAS